MAGLLYCCLHVDHFSTLEGHVIIVTFNPCTLYISANLEKFLKLVYYN